MAAEPLRLKELGNAAFKAREHSKAAKHYQDALKLIGTDAQDADLERACQLNLASCHLTLGEHDAAVELCSCVLDRDARNRKALFRRG